MPGPQYIPPSPLIPDWLRPENASVFDSLWVRAARKVAGILGVDDPRSQILNTMMPLIPEGMETAGPAVKAAQKVIKAFHGSPHDFERFSLEKIGTGEGAQAYGHGLYFAENPATAEAYREGFAREVTSDVMVDGKPWKLDLENPTPTDWALRDLSQQRADAKTLQAIRRTQGNQFADEYVAAVNSYAGRVQPAARPPVYEVAIRADPAHFLDWDKPLNQQPEAFSRLLDAYNFPDERSREVVSELLANRTGAEGYADLARTLGARTTRAAADVYGDEGATQLASRALQQTGTPGLKYLDAASRSTGEGTRNYVVFDDKLIDILRKYGVALPVIEGLRQRSQQQGGSVTQQDLTQAFAQ